MSSSATVVTRSPFVGGRWSRQDWPVPSRAGPMQSARMPDMTTYPVPSGKTARRLEWQFLPPHIRAFIEERCGSKVVAAVSQGAGFTPGFASVLTCDDGSRHFVKAASVKAQRLFADSYREEARKLVALPEAVPAPRLLWSHDEDWVVLGLEYVDGRNPRRPWRPGDLDRCLDALDDLAPILTPPPAGLGLDSFADEFGEVAGYWDHVRATQPGLPHLEEAAALAAGFEDVTAATRWSTPTSVTTTSSSTGPARSGCATGTGRWSAPPGSTRCSCSSGRAATDSTWRQRSRGGRCSATYRPSTSTGSWRCWSASSSDSATSRSRRARRTSVTTSRGRATSAGPGCANAGVGRAVDADH